MKIKSVLMISVTAAMCLGIVDSAQAQRLILTPTSVSSDLEEIPGIFSLANLTNQSGLSSTYMAGTDFDAYIAGAPLHTSGAGTAWISGAGVNPSTPLGSLTFDLGGPVAVESLALWDGVDTQAFLDFTLEASLSSDFSSSTPLGSFTSIVSANPEPAQVFNFTSTTAQFVRLNAITANPGGSLSLGEVIFAQSAPSAAVPEPGTIIGTLAAVALGTGAYLKHRQKQLKS